LGLRIENRKPQSAIDNMQFVYTAKSKTGDIQTGHISAADVDAVKRALREQSLFVIDIRKKVANSTFKAILGWRDKSSLSRRDLLSVTTQLAIMTRSGVDLASAFLSLSQQCSNPTMRNILAQVHKDVTGGKSISDAMQAQAAVFGDAYVASVAAGEAAGKVPEVLGRLSQFQRSEMRVRATVRTLLAYPMLLSGVSGLVVIGLVTFVLPKFVDIFGQFEVALPMITQVIVAMSDMVRKHWLIWVPLIVAAIVGLIVSRNVEGGRRKWDYAMLNMPILKDITRAFYIGRTFRLMGLMIESGVPLLEGLRLTRNSVKNVLYRKLFDDLEESILNGRGLATSLISAGFVPAVAAEMVLTAERTGTLGMVTELMGEHYEEEGESKLRELATLLEPLIIVAMGVIVATIVMAVMLPMFDIATMAK
jgi:type II secretory pathway component PulF